MFIRNRSGAVGLGWALGIIVGIVGIGFIALHTGVGQGLFGRWSFVKSIEQDQGTYYRLKVKLIYKGEPQAFDIVVGCNVRRITYKDGGSTYEAGLIPDVFGRRMTDGKALIVRAPNACQGETTANGRIHADLMPIVVIYDNADTLDVGTAYLSDDAYESPLSALTFGGATIETASRTDFDEFRHSQTNLVTRESYWSRAPDDVLERMHIGRAPKPWAHICEGYKRFKIPEAARILVQQNWPKEHPTYWLPDDGQTQMNEAILAPQDLITTDRQNDTPQRVSTFRWPTTDAADLGALRRSPVSGPPAAAYYPSGSDYEIDRWPPDRTDWLDYISSRDKIAASDVSVQKGESRGFAHCFALGGGWPLSAFGAAMRLKRVGARVDGQYAMSTNSEFNASLKPFWIYERDQYVFTFFSLSLESTRGDV